MSVAVLYIAGTGRSGSTVLANLLGEIDGLTAVGEVRYLWQRGLVERRLCGCGMPVPDCAVWSAILSRTASRGVALDPVSIVGQLGRVNRMRTLPAALAGHRAPRLAPARSAPVDALRATLGDLYASIAHVSEADVVVDSSKLPAYANFLLTVPQVDLRVVHLVRDPRAAAHSWSSYKPLPDGAARSHMERIGAAKSAALWDVWNVAAGRLLDRGPDRYIRIRYEDFVAEPATTMRRLLAMFGREDASLPLVDRHEAVLGLNHMVAGNPDRLQHGTIRVAADDRWRASMSSRDRRIVTAVSGPLLHHYGYQLGVRREAGRSDAGWTIFDRAPAGEGTAARLRRRVRRHLRWSRTEGLARLIEEDGLNPVTRLRVGVAKRRWRSAHPQPAGAATPVYLVGLQRSGTNMLTRGLERAPEFEVHNENDGAAFDRFMLRGDAVVETIVRRSGHRFVLFKPLCDSHRVDDLLDQVRTPSAGRAIWAFRDVDGRARSAVAKFGRNNLLVLHDIVSGNGQSMWQAQRLSPVVLSTLRDFDYTDMSPHTAAALFWWARNSLFFDLALDQRSDVLLASYGDLVGNPRAAMQVICDFLGFAFRPALVAHIAPRRATPVRPLDIDSRVRTLCDELQEQLDRVIQHQHQGRAA